MNTADRVVEYVKNSHDQTKKDGDLIAVLYKLGSELQEECKKAYARIGTLEKEKAEAFEKTAGEDSDNAADKGMSEDDQNQVRDVLRKLAEDDVLDETTIDAHVTKAVESPVHLAKMMDLVRDKLHTVKTASEDEIGSIGTPRPKSSGEVKKTASSIEKANDTEMSKAWADLDRDCGAMLQTV